MGKVVNAFSGDVVFAAGMPKPLIVRKLKLKLSDDKGLNPLKIKFLLNGKELQMREIIPDGSEEEPTALTLVLSDDATAKWTGLALSLNGAIAPALRGDFDRDCDE